MKSLKEALIKKHSTAQSQKGPYWDERDIWFENESKLSIKDIEGDVIDTIGNIITNDRYLKNMNSPDVNYLRYIIDELNIVARCRKKEISDMAAHVLGFTPDEELFKAMIKISDKLGLER